MCKLISLNIYTLPKLCIKNIYHSLGKVYFNKNYFADNPASNFSESSCNPFAEDFTSSDIAE
jgi:hypothetical protein